MGIPFRFFDPAEKVDEITGTSLPHWRQDHSIYFVTFRLADSLPQEKVDFLRQEKTHWLKCHPLPHSQKERQQYHSQFTRRIEDWLDADYGSLLLRHDFAAELIEEALLHFHQDRYLLDAYAVAANHVHVLVAPLQGHLLSKILQSWKGFTARQIAKNPAAKSLSTFPVIWQKESFDHIVRSQESLDRFRRYILSHPTEWKGRPK